MSNFIDSLEPRNHFSVDYSVTLSSTGITGTLTPGGKTKYTSIVHIANVADNLPKGTKLPSIQVTLHSDSGSDIILGTAKVPNLKAGKSKDVKINFKVLSSVPGGTYDITARFTAALAGDINAANDTALGAPVAVSATGGGTTGANPLAKYNLGNTITFTKTGTGEGDGVAGAVHELGTFADTAGHSGNYEYTTGLGIGGLNFDFPNAANSPDFFITATKLKTLKGTYTISTDPAKALLTFKDVNTNETFYFHK